MRIALGQVVFARDGKKVGTVDRLVLDGETHRVEEIVVHKGVLFSSDKLIDRTMIDRAAADGVRLSIDAADEKKLPDFYQGQYYEWNPGEDGMYPLPISGWYAGSLLYVNASPRGRGYPGTGGFFEVAPIHPPNVGPESNLSDTDVLIGHGAEVVGADGHRLGHVHDVLFDEAGSLTGVVVRTDMIRRHDVEIPAALIAETDDDRVRLSVTAAEAEKVTAVV